MNEPGPQAAELSVDRDAVLAQYGSHVNSGLAKLARLANMPLELRSEGNIVYSETDEAFLDCGGFSVFLLGHRHPAVTDAVRRQLDTHPLSTRVLFSPVQAEAAALLASVSPPNLDYVYFTNSGTEAVEAGLKIARLNGKNHVIATEGGFHGKTLGALSVTGRTRFQEPFEPLLPGVEFVPYGDAAALEQAMSQRSGDACVILEPVQGEGGVILPPEGYLRDVRALCSRYDALMILDEIQTGLGRLGLWWGADRDGVAPDILLAGKALGGGIMPVGAAITSAALYARLNRDPLLHSSTFGGNPLAMSAVVATIHTIEREDIVARAAKLGENILQNVRRILAESCPSLVVEVRGAGLLIGVEFTADHIAADFIYELLSRRVILSNSLNTFRVARLTPSALLKESEVTWLFEAVKGAAEALNSRYASKTGPA